MIHLSEGQYPLPDAGSMTARQWARDMYERDMAYQVYAALRDGIHAWLEDPTIPAGFYGYADE